MAGQAEQKRRAAAVERASERARNLAYREMLEVAEHGDLDLVIGYLQAKLGMTKPLEQIRRELRSERIH